MLKILRIEYKNLPIYNGGFATDLYASDRVMKAEALTNIYNTIYIQNLVSFVGINATGKTTALRLINLAARIVIDNISLNEIDNIKYDLIADGTELMVVFCDDQFVYQLHSYISRGRNKLGEKIKYAYREEILRVKQLKTVVSKKDLFDFSDERLTRIVRRSDLDNQTKSVLKPDDSIVIMVTRDNDVTVEDVLTENYVNYSPMMGETPQEVLNAFDDNIEYLNTVTSDQGHVQWVLKFRNQNRIFNIDNPLELNRIISAGTIKGHTLIGLAVRVLYTGGYMIVDELENHFNKELVHVILGLFNHKKSNPHGACLIFTTHYIEILDYINRKDNIYLTRKTGGMLSVSKLSNEIDRNDIKKSDIIISNYLKGTAPKYQQIQKLKEYVCGQIK